MTETDRTNLRDEVRIAYSTAAEMPQEKHRFPAFAEIPNDDDYDLGYSRHGLQAFLRFPRSRRKDCSATLILGTPMCTRPLTKSRPYEVRMEAWRISSTRNNCAHADAARASVGKTPLINGCQRSPRCRRFDAQKSGSEGSRE